MRGILFLLAFALVGCDSTKSEERDSQASGSDSQVADSQAGGPDSLVCPAGLTSCSGSCVDTLTDPHSCGKCGDKCDTQNDFSCKSGKCSCPEGLTNCCYRCCSCWSELRSQRCTF
jgi:hypothetical protein